MRGALWFVIAVLGGIALAVAVHSVTDARPNCPRPGHWSCAVVATATPPPPTPTATVSPTPTATPTPSPTPIPSPPPSIACFDIDGQRDRVYENITVGPCPERAGIMIRNSTNITLRNLTVFGAKTNIEAYQSSVFIEGVTLRDPQGPFPRGQQVLFDHSSGSLRNSTLTFVSGRQEDAVSLWFSYGVLIEGNNISGNSSPTGCGVLLHSGSTQTAVRGNEIHHIQCGIGVAGGTAQVVASNDVHHYWGYGGSANIGLYVWHQDTSLGPCNDIRVTNNRVSPATNAYWNAGNCSNVVWSGNTVY